MKLPASIKLALLSGAALASASCTRSDIENVNKNNVNAASPVGRAAVCIQKNLFPGSQYIRVAEDGYTVSVSRDDPNESLGVKSKTEFSLFIARGISDADAGANGVLALGDENDRNTIAVMENCVVENMRTSINTRLLKPLPAPEGYRSLQSFLGNQGPR